MCSAFEKSVLVPQTVVSPRKTIALIVETKVSIARENNRRIAGAVVLNVVLHLAQDHNQRLLLMF
jgi:hypothetical protein